MKAVILASGLINDGFFVPTLLAKRLLSQ